MKLSKVLPVLLVSTFCLAGCASKVSYDKFHEKAAAVKENSYKKATAKVNLNYESNGTKTEIKGTVKFEYKTLASLGSLSASAWSTDDTSDAAYIAQMFVGNEAKNVSESDDAKYYAGGLLGPKFKVVYEDTTYEYNQFGLLTKMNGKSESGKGTITISYSK